MKHDGRSKGYRLGNRPIRESSLGEDAMITVVAKIPVKEGKMGEALAAFGELMDKVASEEGTVMYSLNKDNANPNVLVVVEQYKDKAALDAHSSSVHFKTFFAAAAAFIGGKPEMTFMEQIRSI